VSAVERLLRDAPSSEITDPVVLARIAAILRTVEPELVRADLSDRSPPAALQAARPRRPDRAGEHLRGEHAPAVFPGGDDAAA
jgi:hypothetical protein